MGALPDRVYHPPVDARWQAINDSNNVLIPPDGYLRPALSTLKGARMSDRPDRAGTVPESEANPPEDISIGFKPWGGSSILRWWTGNQWTDTYTTHNTEE